MDIDKTRIQEIVRLHSEVAGLLRQTLEKAIRIGQLLSEQKQILKHGEFIPWIEANIPFTDRTARNYMQLYRERDRIKTETVSGLKEAYALLTSSREENPEWNPDEWLQMIEAVNAEFFPNHPEYQINLDSEWLWRKLAGDGSMTKREQEGATLQMNYGCHICFWTKYRRVRGEEKTPTPIRKYLDTLGIKETQPLCGECRQDWENDHGNLS
jgi:hypothetical protein